MFFLVPILTLITLCDSQNFESNFNNKSPNNVIPSYQNGRFRSYKRHPQSFHNRHLHNPTEAGRHQPLIPVNPTPGEFHHHPQSPANGNGQYSRIINNPAPVIVIEQARYPYTGQNPQAGQLVASESNIQPRYPYVPSDNFHQHRHNFTAVDGHDLQTSASDGGGWGWGGGGGGGWPQISQHHHHYQQGGWGWGGGNKGGYDFRPYFDIALTALGLLSLGTFLLNMLLNALLFSGLVTSTGTGTGIITTTTTGGTGGTTTGVTVTGGTGGITTTSTGTGFFKKRIAEVEDDEAEESRSFGSVTGCFNASNLFESEARTRRRRRETLDLFLDPATSMNAMAHSVLEGIDAMMYKKECLGKVYCESNRHAKIVGNGFGFLMPLYSISASYMGKKFGWHEDMADHMKGVVLGVGESNCETNFPQC